MRVYGGDSIRAIVGPNLGQSKQSLMYEGWYLNRNKQDWHAGLGDMLFPGKELVTPEDFFPELDLTFKPL